MIHEPFMMSSCDVLHLESTQLLAPLTCMDIYPYALVSIYFLLKIMELDGSATFCVQFPVGTI